jgi:hypothetical protein
VDISLNMSKPLVLDKPTPVTDAVAGAVAGLYRPVQSLWERRGGHMKVVKKGGIGSLFGKRK